MIVLSTVYNAVGLAAYELFDNVDFDQWFKNQLLGELQVSHHRYCFHVLNCFCNDLCRVFVHFGLTCYEVMAS